MKRWWPWILPLGCTAVAFTAPHSVSDLFTVLMVPAWAYAVHRTPVPMNWLGTWLGGAGGNVLAGFAESDWFLVAAGSVSALVATAIWWWRRKDRKRAAKALGYKARALVAALVQRAREAARPRPVLQPQRQAP
jgi:membrane protease YdiL (CAAX protease family)